MFQGVGGGGEASAGVLHFPNTASSFPKSAGQCKAWQVGGVRQRDRHKRGVMQRAMLGFRNVGGGVTKTPHPSVCLL